MDLDVRSGSDAALIRDALEVRRRVFIEEQGISEELEWDGIEDRCLHVVVYANSEAVACGRLVDGRKATRVAVVAAWRGRGLGRLVMLRLEEEAKAMGGAEVVLNAQTSSLAFYSKIGYEAYGEMFLEAGIAHRAMRKRL